MSKALTIAATLAARLDALPLLGGQKVILFKQQDVEGDVKNRIESGLGSALLLFYEGFEQAGAHSAPYPSVTRTYTLRILSRPVLRQGSPTADALMEAAATTLHAWEPLETDGISEIAIPRGSHISDEQLLIYDLTITIESKL